MTVPVEIGPGDLDGGAVLKLLASAVGTEGHRLTEAAHRYRHDPAAELLLATLDGQVIGMVGYVVSDTQVTLLHIATAESLRLHGIGANLIAAVEKSTESRLPLVAETDHASVGFYRALGFTIDSLGQKYPGVERFRVQRSPIR